jgi:hypothetical protein
MDTKRFTVRATIVVDATSRDAAKEQVAAVLRGDITPDFVSTRVGRAKEEAEIPSLGLAAAAGRDED